MEPAVEVVVPLDGQTAAIQVVVLLLLVPLILGALPFNAVAVVFAFYHRHH